MLLETIRCEHGQALHLPYHQQRLDATLQALGIRAAFDLQALMIPPEEGIFRCRFLYGAEGFTIEYHPYAPRTFRSLRIVHADTLDYRHKYADRSGLNALFEQRGACDDVLIVRGGMLCDTTIANIALLIGEQWLTPEEPLLMGTTRARLIDEGVLTPAPLRVGDICRARKVAVMNTMMGLVEVENGIIL